ncbi:MAG: indolepyruvate oxidoreductase subunit beta [Anaerolineaceae bacterium]
MLQSENKTTNFMLVGVGGQGTILASNVLADLGLALGLDVKKAEVHGMSQRGGSVISHLRWGQEVHSPIIAKGEVDILVAFEKLEAVRFVEYVKPDGVVLVNDYAIPPVTTVAGSVAYPSDAEIRSALGQKTKQAYWIPGVKLAKELGNAKVANVIVLGALCSLLKSDEQAWLEAIDSRVPEKHKALNQTAFETGYRYF